MVAREPLPTAHFPLPDVRSTLGRSTLTPMEEGKVRHAVHAIEISTDHSETWRTGFDAVYVPRKPVNDQSCLNPHS